MPGKPAEEIPWPIIYQALQDDTVEPVRKVRAAWEAARAAGQSSRSRAMFERYIAATWVVEHYHADGSFDLRQIDRRIWHRLEEQLRRDLAETPVGPRRLNLDFEAIMERITPRMVERAVAGWYAFREEPEAGERLSAADEAPAATDDQRPHRTWPLPPATVAVPLFLTLVAAGAWWLPAPRQPEPAARAASPTMAAPASQQTPRVTGISPNPMKGRHETERITLAGSGFRQGATVVWVNMETGSRHTIFPDSPDTWVSIRDNEIVLEVLLDEPASTWTAQVINPDGQGSNTVTLHVIPPDPPPPLQVRGVVRLTPTNVAPGGPTAITAEIVNPNFARAEALKLQLNIYQVPRGVASLADLVTGDGVDFLFDRSGLKGPHGLMQQAHFRLSRRVVDGKTYISFTLNLPEDAGVIDYVLNAGTEANSDQHQALLPIRPVGAEPSPVQQAPTS